jgi:hypothetical protein
MKTPLKPIICVTVHRRYTELALNLAASKEKFGEFAVPPEVVLVVAQPERAALPFFERLRHEGLIHHLLFRPSNGLDSPITTYPESHNIQLALRYVSDIWGPESYVLLQAADVCPNKGTYRFVDEHMQQDGDGAVFHWENPTARANVWHTNFFAIRPNHTASWPPIVEPGDADVLERKWGRQLENLPGNWLRTHNSNNKRFVHEHLPISPVPCPEVPLPIRPKKSWWKRWGFFLYLIAV